MASQSKRSGAKRRKFWNGVSRYGLVHTSEQTESTQSKGCLLVFVHGLFGDSRKTWGKMPDWVLANAGVDMDVVSFSYPAKLMQRSNLQRSAEDLATWLLTEYGDYRHLLFITHSSGGLVVKEMLCESWEQENQQRQNTVSSQIDFQSIWYRTRRVINIAVPHQGGSAFSSIAGAISYQVFYLLMSPLLALVRFLTQGGKDLGRNELIALVRTNNAELLELDQLFNDNLASNTSNNLPCPLIHDVFAKSDMAVNIQKNSAGRHPLYVRGTHRTVKVPNRSSGPIVRIVADIVKLYADPIALTIADQTLQRIQSINSMSSTNVSLGSELVAMDAGQSTTQNNDVAPQPKIATVHYGSQSAVIDLVVKAIDKGSEQPRQLLVTGTAGVGKSMVLRSITWVLASRYLQQSSASSPLPLFVPMQQITVQTGEQMLDWDGIWAWWLRWSRDIYQGKQYSEEQLESIFQHQKVTILLDGFVDFLMNYPGVGFSHMVNLLEETRNRYRSNPGFTIVLGVRNSFYGLQNLALDPKNVFEVLRLTASQAKQYYPKSREWVDLVEDTDLLDLVLTPLILENYEPCEQCSFQKGVATQASILCQTIRTILLRSNLVGMPVVGQQRATIDQLNHALVIVAWLFFFRSRGEISIDVLTVEATQARERWHQYFDTVKQQDKLFYNELLQEVDQDLQVAFSILEDATTCKQLLEQTLFVPTGANRFRFSHRSWKEYLLAHYLVLCVRTHHFLELGSTACNSRIYKLAGEAFANKVISEPCVVSLLETWEQTHNPYISGNVIAFMCWGNVPLDVAALAMLLEAAPRFEMLSRLVLFGGLGYRVLSNQSGDISVSDIRRALSPQLKKYSMSETALPDDPVLSSLAWCYQKAFANLYGLPLPEQECPHLDFSDEVSSLALPMVCTQKDGQWVLDARSKTLQIALLVPVQESFKDANLAIRAVHYLYYLVVARKYGVHVLQLSEELPLLLAKDSRFEAMVESFTVVPEVLDLYRRCQAFHIDLERAVA